MWYENEETVHKLLAYPTCDSEVKTKQGRNVSGPGKTPLWLARHLKQNTPIASILNQFSNERKQRFGGTIPTYTTAKDGQKMDRDGLPLLLLSLANYKQMYHPGVISPHIAFGALLKQVFDYVDDSKSSHWESAMEKTSSSICGFDKAAADYLSTDMASLETTDEQRFFARTVKLYTKNHIYREVNNSLRRQCQGSKYKPTADDLTLGPYTLLLDTLLFYWPELRPVSTTTYRGMDLHDSDIKKYTVGTQFVWLNFISSSMDKSIANKFGNTLFEISNDTSNAVYWRPRDLSHAFLDLHEYQEEEALYPAGAEFLVTAIDKIDGKRRIKLRLMCPTCCICSHVASIKI